MNKRLSSRVGSLLLAGLMMLATVVGDIIPVYAEVSESILNNDWISEGIESANSEVEALLEENNTGVPAGDSVTNDAAMLVSYDVSEEIADISDDTSACEADGNDESVSVNEIYNDEYDDFDITPDGYGTSNRLIKTQAEAVAWLRDQNGQRYDMGTPGGAQCTVFASAYMNWLATGDPYSWTYNVYWPKDYIGVANNEPHNYWTEENYAALVPSPGDIFISDNWGHIGVVVEAYGTEEALVIEQNTANDDYYGSPALMHRISWGWKHGGPNYFIHPIFAPPAPTPAPKPQGKPMTQGYVRAVPDGYYQIVSDLDSNYALDIQGYAASEISDGSKLQLFKNRNVNQDVFELTYNSSDRFYRIKHVLSGKYLDVKDASPYMEAEVQAFYNKPSEAAQKWAIQGAGDGKNYYIYPKVSGGSGFRLDVKGGRIDAIDATRPPLWIYESIDYSAQKWRLVPYPNGTAKTIENGNYHIVSKMDNATKGLNVAGTSGNFKNVTAVANLTNASQVFNVAFESSTNSYIIKQKDTKYYLEVENAGKTRNIGVATGDANGNPDGNWKKWNILNSPSASGWYYIASRETGESIHYNYSQYKENVQPVKGDKIYDDQLWKFVRAVDSVSISKSSASTKVGTNITLTATVSPSSAANKNVTWSSSNTNVATVNSSGVVTPKTAGTTNITVKTVDGGYTATCNVTVNAINVTGVSLNKSKTTLISGKQETLTAIVTPSNATNKNIIWLSSNTNVATVSSGVVVAKSEGTADIIAKTSDGDKTATCKVTVVSTPVITTVALPEGKAYDFYQYILAASGTKPISWKITCFYQDSTAGGRLEIDEATGKLTLDSETGGGKLHFLVEASNPYGKASKEFNLFIKEDEPKIITESLPDATVGEYYKQEIEVLNGRSIACLMVADGQMPKGMGCNVHGFTDGRMGTQMHYIHGTPMETGVYEFTLSGETNSGITEKKLTLRVNKSLNGADAICGDNATFKLYDDGTLVISGTGELYSASRQIWYENRDKIKHIVIEKGITSLTSENDYRGQTFAFLENLEDVILPDGLKYIPRNSFYGCSAINEITIPSTVTYIEVGTFRNSSLQVIRIPKTITGIGSCVFNGTNLTDIYYEGSEAEWDQIDINSDNREVINKTTIHFNSKIKQPVPNNSYNVKFLSVGEVYKTISVYEGKIAKKPIDPIRDNFKFDGWYIDKNCSKEFDFNTPITRDTTIYAKWVRENIVTGKNVTIVAGQKINLKETCFRNVDESISRYIVDNKKVATISKTMLSGVKAGTVNVTAQSLVGKNRYEDVATCNVIVLNKPKLKFGIPMTYEGQTIYASDYFTTSDTNTLGATFWESSKPDVVEVTDSTDGLLTAHKSGSAKITAYFGEKGKTGTLKVSATINVKKPAFQKSDYKLLTGGKTVLAMKNVVKAQNPEWVTEDENVAVAEKQLDKNGQPTGKVIVNALNCGDTVLTARIDGQEYKCTIHVGAPEISKTKLTIKVNKNATVSLKNTKLPKSSIEWYSENPGIAAVSPNGKVKGIEKGQTIIYTEAGGVRNECVVTVK